MVITFLSTCLMVAVITMLITLLCYRRMKKNLLKYQRINDQEEIHDVMKEHIGQRDKWSIANTSLRKSQTLLGQGSSSQVHKGYFKPSGSKVVEEVAIKSLVPRGRTYKSYMNLTNEIRCLIKLYGNLNIVAFKGFVLQKDDKCFLMENARRGDLLNHLRCHADVITKEKSKELLGYTRHITQGMQYMKRKHILHRDLSSRNILLFDDNLAKISDFGLSRDVSETGGIFIETPWTEGQTAPPLRWMPPEFLTRGEFHFKSDVWSFGVLLWEVGAQGAVPFEDDTSYQFIRRIARGETLPKPQICTDEAYRIMCKCWERPLEMRPSAEQLTANLDLLMEGKGLFAVGIGDRRDTEGEILPK
ncbi:tyrosine-protein kinase Fer-like [Ptychodera flava]|uniref:tyrosine-protein kinase Fer-like n=1 Tax=Ptychodera flava TaxID=63121 RepID=UPI00396A82AF